LTLYNIILILIYKYWLKKKNFLRIINIKFLVADINKICQKCYSTCESGKCLIGNSEISCTKCTSDLFYDSSTKKCLTADQCSEGLKGFI